MSVFLHQQDVQTFEKLENPMGRGIMGGLSPLVMILGVAVGVADRFSFRLTRIIGAIQVKFRGRPWPRSHDGLFVG